MDVQKLQDIINTSTNPKAVERAKKQLEQAAVSAANPPPISPKAATPSSSASPKNPLSNKMKSMIAVAAKKAQNKTKSKGDEWEGGYRRNSFFNFNHCY